MKKWICLLLAIAMIIALTACTHSATVGPDDNPGTNNPTPEQNVSEMTKPSENVEETTQPAAALPVTPPVVEEDPLEELIVSRGVAESLGGLYLKRDDKYYSLSAEVRRRATSKMRYGYLNALGGLYLYCATNSDSFSMGDVPVPVLEEGDKIVYFSSSGDVPILELSQMEFAGYTIPIEKRDYTYELTSLDVNNQRYIELWKNDINEFTISDSAGNVIKDWRSLEQNEKYIVSWFSGTQYNEIEMVANCKYYKVISGFINGKATRIEGLLSKEGYAEFDLSQVPSGTYRFWLDGLIQIP